MYYYSEHSQNYIDNDMMSSIYGLEKKDDSFVFITLISRFECYYEL